MRIERSSEEEQIVEKDTTSFRSKLDVTFHKESLHRFWDNYTKNQSLFLPLFPGHILVRSALVIL